MLFLRITCLECYSLFSNPGYVHLGSCLYQKCDDLASWGGLINEYVLCHSSPTMKDLRIWYYMTCHMKSHNRTQTISGRLVCILLCSIILGYVLAEL
jgi:hypothetical protein